MQHEAAQYKKGTIHSITTSAPPSDVTSKQPPYTREAQWRPTRSSPTQSLTRISLQ